MEEIFTHIYEHDCWGDSETASGFGSNTFNTVAIRRELPIVLRNLGIRSMLDVPCGDHHWIQELKLDIEEYIGADIVGELVRRNAQTFANAQKRFYQLDITRDPIPRVDLIFCRDCLVHFSFADISLALHNMRRSGSLYLMTTTFTSVGDNVDIQTGDWRQINLQLPPFDFPEPLLLICEHGIGDGGEDYNKCMGVWKLSDLPG